MAKNTIKLNETKLRQMIAESVKNVLEEEIGVAPKRNPVQIASVKAKNLQYEINELIDIVKEISATSPEYGQILNDLQRGYNALNSLAQAL
jgi:hypothetical protein